MAGFQPFHLSKIPLISGKIIKFPDWRNFSSISCASGNPVWSPDGVTAEKKFYCRGNQSWKESWQKNVCLFKTRLHDVIMTLWGCSHVATMTVVNTNNTLHSCLWKCSHGVITISFPDGLHRYQWVCSHKKQFYCNGCHTMWMGLNGHGLIRQNWNGTGTGIRKNGSLYISLNTSNCNLCGDVTGTILWHCISPSPGPGPVPT